VRPTSTKANDLQSQQQQQATTSRAGDNSDRGKSSLNAPRPGHKIQFKSRKQQLEEEARRKLLKSKIKCNYSECGTDFLPPVIEHVIPPIYFTKRPRSFLY